MGCGVCDMGLRSTGQGRRCRRGRVSAHATDRPKEEAVPYGSASHGLFAAKKKKEK